MSIALRVLLFAASLGTMLFVARRIRRAQIRVEDTLFWMGFTVVLLVLSVFPNIAIRAAQLLGVQSPVNFIFLCIIFVLMIKLFLMSVQLSMLTEKVKRLAQWVAIGEKEEREKPVLSGMDSKTEEA